MALIDVTELKQKLRIYNVTADLSDEDLELLLNNTILELAGRIGVPIETEQHKEMVRDFKNDMFELTWYPVQQISSIAVGSKTLGPEDYVLDESLGILYFNTTLKGFLVVEYCSCLPDNVIDTKINSLVLDIIRYRLTNGFSSEGSISSIKEMDTQINYDTSSSLGSLIESRINNLRSSYSVRIKVL